MNLTGYNAGKNITAEFFLDFIQDSCLICRTKPSWEALLSPKRFTSFLFQMPESLHGLFFFFAFIYSRKKKFKDLCYFQYKDHHRLQKGCSYQVFTWELCAFSHESEPPLKQKQFVFTTLQQRYHQWRWQPEGFQVLVAMWRKFRAIWEIISESFER